MHKPDTEMTLYISVFTFITFVSFTGNLSDAVVRFRDTKEVWGKESRYALAHFVLTLWGILLLL